MRGPPGGFGSAPYPLALPRSTRPPGHSSPYSARATRLATERPCRGSRRPKIRTRLVRVARENAWARETIDGSPVSPAPSSIIAQRRNALAWDPARARRAVHPARGLRANRTDHVFGGLI